MSAPGAGEASGATGASGRTIVSPYRICPVGAHVDHQGGRMLATAIDLGTRLVFEPADEVVVTSRDFEGEVRFAPAAIRERLPPGALPEWGRYVWAAGAVLRDRLPRAPRGFRATLEGDAPGAGLSSSASLLLACLKAWAEANERSLEAEELVRATVAAENEHVGVACGVLDPAAIVGSRRGALLAIEADRIAWQATPLGPTAPPHRFLAFLTGTRRHLAGTDFNRRVAECRSAARRAGERLGRPDATRLGDLDRDALRDLAPTLAGVEARRARHFIGECDRVDAARAAWSDGRLADFGALMLDSCRSSIELYETGSPELVALQAIWASTPGVLGARFSGAGFGGSSIALVEAGRAEEVAARVVERFAETFPALAAEARVVVVESADGLGVR